MSTRGKNHVTKKSVGTNSCIEFVLLHRRTSDEVGTVAQIVMWLNHQLGRFRFHGSLAVEATHTNADKKPAHTLYRRMLVPDHLIQ